MEIMDTVAIEDIIAEHGDYVGIDYHFLPADEFTESFGHLPTARFGWTWPEVGFFCPEMIAAQTVILSSEDCEHYVRAILWICDKHITYAFQQSELSRGDRHRLIEGEMYDVAPGSMDLMSEVELAVLEGA